MSKLELSERKIIEIESFLEKRFQYFETLRNPLDITIQEEIDLANDIDKNMKDFNLVTKKGKHAWEEKRTIPYIYTIIQTMVARLIATFFGKQNYLKIYVEDKAFKNIHKSLQRWIQLECDKMKLKERSRDYLEEALTMRTSWLLLRPEFGGKYKRNIVDFNIYNFLEVWFDTKAKCVEESDFFLRNVVPLYEIKQDKDYFNLEDIEKTIPPDDIKDNQIYEAKNKERYYYDTSMNSTTDKIEIIDYRGIYDIGKKKNNPKYEEVIFGWANRARLVRAETNDIKTIKKRLIFPIRPMRQANSLIGKSPANLVKNLQYLLNQLLSWIVQNYGLQVKLLFKYKKDSGLNLDEFFAKGGNAIGWEDDPNEVQTFDVKDMVQMGIILLGQVIQLIQQTTGAVDYLMGTSAGRGVTETASGIEQITQQAMFKFTMMAENVYYDILEFLNYVVVLWSIYDPDSVKQNFPELKDFIDQDPKVLEESRAIDIGMTDLTLRRDVERSQFINAVNILAGLLTQVQGNVPELLRQIMDKLEVENVDEIMKGAKTPAEIQGLLTAAAEKIQAEQNQKKGGSNKADPQADVETMPEEESSNTTPSK